MATSFTDWESDYLAHFGTKGMKWGQRRFQNPDGSLTALGKERYGINGDRSARGMKHDLNKLDREQANAKVRYDAHNNASIRASAKVRNKMVEAMARKDKKAVQNLRKEQKKIDDKHTQKAAEYKRLLENSQKMTNRILESAKAKGYSVHSRDCIREVNRGRNFAASIAFSTVGQAVGGVTVGVSSYATGKHYRVKNDGLGTRTHRSTRYRGYAG